MSIKIEAIKALFFIAIGAFIWAKIQPQTSSNEPKVVQSQSQGCSVVVKKVVRKDGTVSETTEVVASQKQDQVVLSNNNKNALLLGVWTDKKASANLILGKWSHEIRTDFVKDHVYQLSYKVLEF